MVQEHSNPHEVSTTHTKSQTVYHVHVSAHRSPLSLLTPSSSTPFLSRNLRSTSLAMQHSPNSESNIEQAISYHNRTKHSLSSGYARGPHGLDWAHQPNQFLHFTSRNPSIPLLHFPPLPNDSPLYSSLLSSPLSPPRHVDLPSISRLLYDSLSLSAWKSTPFSTWSLRVNPSSGNLHPTESHLTNSLSTPLIFYCSPKHHSLSPRAHLDIPGPGLFLSLSSIFWREAWKYGEHVYWDVIYKTADAIKKPRTEEDLVYVPPLRPSGMIWKGLYKGYTVREVVRMRRSAVDMDGVHVMGRDTFYQILLRCLPSGEVGAGERQGRQMAVSFRVLTWDAEVHAAIFVHSVEGLAKGVYFLVRNEGHLGRLKAAMRGDFEWARPEGCPDVLPLYRLVSGNYKQLAKMLSCHQVLFVM